MKERKIKTLTAAKDDLKEARAWYKQQNPSLPKRFTQQVKKTINNLKTKPVTHAVRYKEVHFAQIPVFPYAVHYILEQDTAIVIAVLHNSINPSKWKRV